MVLLALLQLQVAGTVAVLEGQLLLAMLLLAMLQIVLLPADAYMLVCNLGMQQQCH